MNQVQLCGILDSAKVNTVNDKTVVNFKVLHTYRAKDKSIVTSIPCRAFGKTADIINKYFKEGYSILLDGRLGEFEYTQNGEKKKMLVVNTSHVHFTGKKKDSNNNSQNESVGNPFNL